MFLNKFILISFLASVSACSNNANLYGIYEYNAANDGSEKWGQSDNN